MFGQVRSRVGVYLAHLVYRGPMKLVTNLGCVTVSQSEIDGGPTAKLISDKSCSASGMVAGVEESIGSSLLQLLVMELLLPHAVLTLWPRAHIDAEVLSSVQSSSVGSGAGEAAPTAKPNRLSARIASDSDMHRPAPALICLS